MIKVFPVNHSYIRIECPEDITAELCDYFTFETPGASHQARVINKKRKEKYGEGKGKWDGKTRIFSKVTKLLYRGLLPYVESFALERGYDFSCVGDIDLADDISLNVIKAFVEALRLHSEGNPITPHDYQLKAVAHALRVRRTVLLSPTASGKSLIIYLIVRWLLLKTNFKGLIVVPSTGLVEQLFKDFKDYSSENKWNVDKHVHFVYAGREKSTNKSITISTWQSIFEQDSNFFSGFDFVIGDEAHGFKAKSLQAVMSNLNNAYYRIGTTGTIDDLLVHKLILEGLFGPVEKVISTKELMDQGHVAKLRIKCLVLKHSKEECKTLTSGKFLNEIDYEYPDEIDYLVNNETRNRFIKNLAISMKENTLVLFNKIEHGKTLYSMIKSECDAVNRNVYLIYGNTEVEIREEIRAILAKENDAILVASYGTFSTGSNVKNLYNVIFASPSKSRIRNLQSIGRALRKYLDKTATLFDIADNLTEEDAYIKNHTFRHFMIRLKIYNEERFEYKLYKISI